MSRFNVLDQKSLVTSQNSALIDLQIALNDIQLLHREFQARVVLLGYQRFRRASDHPLSAKEEVLPQHQIHLKGISNCLKFLRWLLNIDLNTICLIDVVRVDGI